MRDRAYACALPLALGLFVGAFGIQVPVPNIDLHLSDLDHRYFRDIIVAFAFFVGAGLGLPFPEELLIVYYGVWTATHPEYGAFRFLMLPVCIVGAFMEALVGPLAPTKGTGPRADRHLIEQITQFCLRASVGAPESKT